MAVHEFSHAQRYKLSDLLLSSGVDVGWMLEMVGGGSFDKFLELGVEVYYGLFEDHVGAGFSKLGFPE